MNAQNKTKNEEPAHSWLFGHLSAAELLPLLQQHLLAQDDKAPWQLVWLNNEGQPMIGLLPKVSWSVYLNESNTDTFNPEKPTALYSTALYKVLKTCRDTSFDSTCFPNTYPAIKNTTVTSYMSYSDWQDELINYSKTYENSDNACILNSKKNEQDQSSSYRHGLVGFIGYDIAAHELSPAAKIEQALQPCAVLGHYDIYLTPIDEVGCSDKKGWQLNIEINQNRTEDDISDSELLTTLIAYLNSLDNLLNNKLLAKSQAQPKNSLAPLILTAQWHKNDYQRAFEHTQHYLRQGDCYQINLTQTWQGRLKSAYHNQSTSTLLDYLPALHGNTQAPFAGYMAINELNNKKTDELQNAGFELLSCSPELFFTFIKDRQTDTYHIRTKPIKGTQPRSHDAKQDAALKQQLIDSDKDRSENVMIVDLLRNDLGKYAKTGSVKVPQLFDIESFSNVHHMVSTITAELAADTHPLAVLFGSLPAGSITGTPKKRAVEIISELEIAPRGAYCGTLGYMNFDGSGQWNVLIRSLQANSLPNGDKEVSLWAGGGITIASNCSDEYQECLDKVGNLLTVLTQKTYSEV